MCRQVLPTFSYTPLLSLHKDFLAYFGTFLAQVSYSAHSYSFTLVTTTEYVQVHPGKVISAVAETIAVESRKVVVVEEAMVQTGGKMLPTQIIPEMKISQPVRKRDDDWFVLLDVVPRETSYVPPGTCSLHMPVFSFHTYCIREDYLTDEQAHYPEITSI